MQSISREKLLQKLRKWTWIVAKEDSHTVKSQSQSLFALGPSVLASVSEVSVISVTGSVWVSAWCDD